MGKAPALPTGVQYDDMWAKRELELARPLEALEQRRIKRHLFRVNDPGNPNRKPKRRFEHYDEGLRWARETRQALEAGEPVGPQKAPEHLPVSHYLQLWVDRAKQSGRGAEWISNTAMAVGHAISCGLDDWWAEDYGRRVQHWLATDTPIGQNSKRGLAPLTKKKRLVQLKMIVNLALQYERIAWNPLFDVQPPKIDRKEKETLPLDLIASMLSCKNHAAWLFCALGLYTGMRSAAIAHLRWQNINLEDGWLGVRFDGDWQPKRARERDLPLQPELAAVLREIEPSGPYVLPDWWRDTTRKMASNAFRDLILDTGADPRPYSPHCMRHTWITLLLATGEPSSYVRDWAGHSSVTTTEGYGRQVLRYRARIKDWPRGELRLMSQS